MHQARNLYCEDCLVPQAYVDLLAAEQGPIGQDWPLSVFMMRLAAEMPELSVLPTGTEAGRRDLTCALMILALSRPDILRYMPTAGLDKALRRTAETGQTPLARFCTEMGQPQEDLTRQSYAAALRPAGFDLERMRFMTLTAEGHRAEFARFAELRDGGAAELRGDIQVIGPFRKASGLGQATRLSADLLERAGYTVHRVDFALDNPSPEDAARVAATDIRPARINLFHLNAETVPLAAAYLPDAFSSAYNIAYVFWELDSPGACHPLGLDLVDEIWVAPEWGVEVFQPHTDKPVVNVGMSFETLPEIDRTDARRFMEHTAQVPPKSFVFLVTFDSFSFMMRKNPLGVIEAFTRAFKDEPEVRLVLKTQNRTRVADPAQAGIWQAVDAAVQQDARIVLINETLPYEDILRLKTGADAYLSLHRSEGWGFGMIEAMNLRVPVVATAYSGNMDFCTPDTCWLVDYSLTEVGPQAYICPARPEMGRSGCGGRGPPDAPAVRPPQRARHPRRGRPRTGSDPVFRSSHRRALRSTGAHDPVRTRGARRPGPRAELSGERRANAQDPGSACRLPPDRRRSDPPVADRSRRNPVPAAADLRTG
jgi:glycosyltransferase involved in cell wall biosynthesis